MSRKTNITAAGIYRITVARDGKAPKFYIGQASNFRWRKKGHFKALRKGTHPNPALQNAFRKYGPEAFTFEIVLVCEKDRVKLAAHEQRIVDEYQPSELYNVHLSCTVSPLGTKRTDEVKARLSAAQKSVPRSLEWNANVAAALRGHVISAETRAKISASLRGRKEPPEVRAKKSASHKGKPLSEAHKRAAVEGRWGVRP